MSSIMEEAADSKAALRKPTPEALPESEDKDVKTLFDDDDDGDYGGMDDVDLLASELVAL